MNTDKTSSFTEGRDLIFKRVTNANAPRENVFKAWTDSAIFINLHVRDLDNSMAIGFSFNPQFTDKTAACMVISDDIYAMLLFHDKVKEFSKKPIADAQKTIEVLTWLAHWRSLYRRQIGCLVTQLSNRLGQGSDWKTPDEFHNGGLPRETAD